MAAAGWRSEPGAPSPQLNLASKQLRLVQTQANKALIKLSNAKPGQVARGTTLVTTTGTTANVTIRANNLVDLPGPNGGKLIASRRLWIDVRCVATPCPHNPAAYRGPLALMGMTGDNLYQHSTARFGLLWSATAG